MRTDQTEGISLVDLVNEVSKTAPKMFLGIEGNEHVLEYIPLKCVLELVSEEHMIELADAAINNEADIYSIISNQLDHVFIRVTPLNTVQFFGHNI